MAGPPDSLPIRCINVAATVLRLGQGPARVLLLRRRTGTFAGLWCQVTGTIEAQESAALAALREVREETGLVPDGLYSADVCDQFYNAGENCIEVVPIFVAVLKTEQPVRLNRENSEYRWVTIDEAVGLVPFVGHRSALRHIENDFVKRTPDAWRQIPMDAKQ